MPDNLMDKTTYGKINDQVTKHYKTIKIGENKDANNTSLFYEPSDSNDTGIAANPNSSTYSYTIDYNKYIQVGDADPSITRKDHYNALKELGPYNSTNENDIDMDALIEWSEKTNNGKLRYQDFAFCKRFGNYPNNRLAILRRYPYPIKDNIFDTKIKMKPMSTMLNWVSPEEFSSLMKFSFNEKWTGHNTDFMDFVKSYFTNNKAVAGLKSKFGDLNTTKVIGQEGVDFIEELVAYTFLSKLVTESGTKTSTASLLERFPEGNPNLIKEAQKRVVGGGGLSGEFSFDLEFEYVADRYLSSIDPAIAFLDLLGNAMRMSTSDSEFKLPPEVGDDFTNKLIAGDISGLVNTVLGSLTSVISGDSSTDTNTPSILDRITSKFKGEDPKPTNKTQPTASDEKTLGFGPNQIFKSLVSKYVEDIKAAYSVMTGAPSGLWHLTIGNPKSPILSIGDLVVKRSTITFGSELGYNDLPTSFKYSVTVASARNRGRQEIESIFNSGRGRIYKRVQTDGSIDPLDDALFIRQIRNRAAPPAKAPNTNSVGQTPTLSTPGLGSSVPVDTKSAQTTK